MDPPRWPQLECKVVETGFVFGKRKVFLQAGLGGYWDSDLAEEFHEMLKGIATYGPDLKEIGR